jgi:hypothetical protein
MFIKPWDEKSKRILDQLTKDRIVYIDDPDVSRKAGRMWTELFDSGFADLSNIKRKHESIITLRPNISIMPLKERNKYKFFRIF